MTKLIELNEYIKTIEESNSGIAQIEIAKKLGVSYRTLRYRLSNQEKTFIDPKTLVHYYAKANFLYSESLDSNAQEGVEIDAQKLGKMLERHKPRNITMAEYGRLAGYKKNTFAALINTNSDDYLVSVKTGRIYVPKKNRLPKSTA